MSSFSKESFISRLRNLTTTQQAIQTLSLWCLHHRKHSNIVVSIWRDEFQQCQPTKRIILLYLANDIIQNSRKKGPEFRLSFQTVLKEAIRMASQTDSKTYNATQRLLDIWEERAVFDEDFLRMLKSVHIEPRNHLSPVDELLSGGGAGPDSTLQPSLSKKSSESSVNHISSSHLHSQIKGSPTSSSGATMRETFSPIALADLEDNADEGGGLSLAQALESPPAFDELIEALQMVTDNTPSADKDARECIASIPPEISDYKDASLDKRLRNKRDASSLIDQATSAADTVTFYTKRLGAEQAERRKLAVRLRSFLVQQRNLLLRDSQLLEESRARLIKVTSVRSELLKHLSNLPDLSQLPDLARLAPLPAPKDLFR